MPSVGAPAGTPHPVPIPVAIPDSIMSRTSSIMESSQVALVRSHDLGPLHVLGQGHGCGQGHGLGHGHEAPDDPDERVQHDDVDERAQQEPDPRAQQHARTKDPTQSASQEMSPLRRQVIIGLPCGPDTRVKNAARNGHEEQMWLNVSTSTMVSVVMRVTICLLMMQG